MGRGQLRWVVLVAWCMTALSAGPVLAEQGRGHGNGRPNASQKSKPNKDKRHDKNDKDNDKDNKDRDRRDDDRGRDDRRSDDGEMRFRGLDQNNDGVITRREWRGNDRSFANHDWNRDGVLSGDEVRPGATKPGRRRY